MASKRQSKTFTSNGTPTATTIVATFDSDVKKGSAIAVVAGWGAASITAFVSIADSQGNVYRTVDALDATGDAHMQFVAKNVAGGPCTVTLTVNPAQGYRNMTIIEIDGADTFDPLDQHKIVSQGAPGTGPDGITTGNVTTTMDGELIVGGAYVDNTVTITLTQGTGFTIDATFGGGVDAAPFATETLVQAAKGAIAATFTMSSGNATTSYIMTFKPAPNAGIAWTTG